MSFHLYIMFSMPSNWFTLRLKPKPLMHVNVPNSLAAAFSDSPLWVLSARGMFWLRFSSVIHHIYWFNPQNSSFKDSKKTQARIKRSEGCILKLSFFQQSVSNSFIHTLCVSCSPMVQSIFPVLLLIYFLFLPLPKCILVTVLLYSFKATTTHHPDFCESVCLWIGDRQIQNRQNEIFIGSASALLLRALHNSDIAEITSLFPQWQRSLVLRIWQCDRAPFIHLLYHPVCLFLRDVYSLICCILIPLCVKHWAHSCFNLCRTAISISTNSN